MVPQYGRREPSSTRKCQFDGARFFLSGQPLFTGNSITDASTRHSKGGLSDRSDETCAGPCRGNWSGHSPDCTGRCDLPWDHTSTLHICLPCMDDVTYPEGIAPWEGLVHKKCCFGAADEAPEHLGSQPADRPTATSCSGYSTAQPPDVYGTSGGFLPISAPGRHLDQPASVDLDPEACPEGFFSTAGEMAPEPTSRSSKRVGANWPRSYSESDVERSCSTSHELACVGAPVAPQYGRREPSSTRKCQIDVSRLCPSSRVDNQGQPACTPP